MREEKEKDAGEKNAEKCEIAVDGGTQIPKWARYRVIISCRNSPSEVAITLLALMTIYPQRKV